MNPLFKQGLNRIVCSADGILMSGLSFQKYVLNLPILILISFRMIFNIIRHNFSLHDPGLLCVTSYIIQFLPLHQILPDRFPVKKENRDIFLFCHPDNAGWCRSVNQIHTQYITAGVNHLLNDLILILLIIIAVFYRCDDFHMICFHFFQILF